MPQVDFQGSPHFHRQELACHCGCGGALIEPELVQALEALRDLAEGPVVITDAYRCPHHNRAVGGVPNSQHVLGRAADLIVAGSSSVLGMLALAKQIPAFSRGGIGLYTGEDGTSPRLHCDVRPDGPARWGVRWGEKEVGINEARVAVQMAGAKAKPAEISS